jgi:aspartyl/glutamyl-tRNA(Asn/Gln) amidotransferase C subunit
MDENSLRRIADLARLRLDEAELVAFERELAQILEYFRVLEAIDADPGTESSFRGGSPIALREDLVVPFPGLESMRGGVPRVHEGFVEVPGFFLAEE